MKLLLDQNVSFRLVKRIINLYPGTAQVIQLNLENSSDLEIRRFAKENYFSIFTFDSYFFNVANYGTPPKIIWLRGVKNNSELSCLTLR